MKKAVARECGEQRNSEKISKIRVIEKKGKKSVSEQLMKFFFLTCQRHIKITVNSDNTHKLFETEKIFFFMFQKNQ